MQATIIKRSRSVRSFAIAAGLCAVLATFGTLPAQAAGEANHPAVGSWFFTSFDGSQLVGNIHPNGTFNLNLDTNDLEGGYLHEYSGQGAWVKTGPNSVRGTGYVPNFDAEGNHLYWQRAHMSAEVSADGQSFTATMYVEIMLPFQDITNPDEAPIGPTVGPVSITGKRINVLPFGPLDDN